MLKRKNKIENNKGSKSQLIIVGSLLIILGTLIIGGKYLYNYLETKNEEQLIDTFFEEQKEIAEDTTPEVPEEKVETEKPQPTKTKIDYFAVIKIPKIGLEKGLANKGSYYNNVNRNILVVKESDMPDKDKGNVILAGHSGSGRTAYFKNLHKLERDDEVSIFYNGNEYKYKVLNQYDIEKTGTANIVRNAEKSTLTLITCRHNTNKQIIYICELVEKV
jgi:LPXTG-site transpeptidase (sortase) family protein